MYRLRLSSSSLNFSGKGLAGSETSAWKTVHSLKLKSSASAKALVWPGRAGAQVVLGIVGNVVDTAAGGQLPGSLVAKLGDPGPLEDGQFLR